MDQSDGSHGMSGGSEFETLGSFTSDRWNSGPMQHVLVQDMLRHGVKLYGTRWCTNCSEQKAMLYQLASERSSWKTMYVDCDLLLNSLETAFIKQVPAWKVGNEYHLGMQSADTLRSLVDRVGGQKKQWKTGGASQWQRRHRQRALWAKQDYAVLVKEAIARGKARAAADKATRRITPQMAEMHPPQPTPVRTAAKRLPVVTVLRTAGASRPVEQQARTQRPHMPSLAPSLATHATADQQAVRSQPLSPGFFRNQLRFRAPAFPPLHEHFPFLAQWREMRVKKTGAENTQGAMAPLGWFRDRFTDGDYGQLFETVAKIRLLSLPHLLAMPQLFRPAFARASSAVEAAGFDFRPQESRAVATQRAEVPSSRRGRQEGGSFRGLQVSPVVVALPEAESVRAQGRGTDSSRRPWWRSIFSW